MKNDILLDELQSSIMDDLTAINTIEGGECDYDEYIAAFQHLYNSGTWKHLQGSYQRTMVQLIEQGEIEQAVFEA